MGETHIIDQLRLSLYGLFWELLSKERRACNGPCIELYDLSSTSFSAWLIFSLSPLLDLTKIPQLRIATKKHKQHVKYSNRTRTIAKSEQMWILKVKTFKLGVSKNKLTGTALDVEEII